MGGGSGCATLSPIMASRAAFEAVWARFERLDVLTLFSETVEGQWTRGRSAYLAFLVPIEDDAVRAHIWRVVKQIREIPGVEAYPQTYSHMTVKGAGFEVDGRASDGEIASQDVGNVAEAARRVFADVAAFEARIGLANGFPEVVFTE